MKALLSFLSATFLAITPLAGGAEIAYPDIHTNAFKRDNGLRGEICLNGLWQYQQVQQVKKGNHKNPDESNWTEQRVPSANYFVPENDSWFGRQVCIPGEWKNRDVFLEFESVNGVVRIGDQQMDVTSGDIFWKFKLDYSAQPLRVRVKAKTIHRDVWLRSYPKQARINFATVNPSWQQKKLVSQLFGSVSGASKTNSYLARIRVAEDQAFAREVKAGQAIALPDTNTFAVRSEMEWANPKPWTPDTPNLYWFAADLQHTNGNVIDRTFPVRFGFREIWVQQGCLMLNGMPLFIRGMDNAIVNTCGDNPEVVRIVIERYKKVMNVNAMTVASQNAETFFNVADEIGMLCWAGGQGNAPGGVANIVKNPLLADAGRREILTQFRLYNHHPSLAMWKQQRRVYAIIDIAPWLLDQKYNIRANYSDTAKTVEEETLRAKALNRELDPFRPRFATFGGFDRQIDLWCNNVYINPDCGLEERCNWPLAWWQKRANLRPILLNEVDNNIWPVFFQRRTPGHFQYETNSEPIILELGSVLWGDRAFMDEPDEYVRDVYFKNGKMAGEVMGRDMRPPMLLKFKNEYLKHWYVNWRTYGINMMLHCEHQTGWLWENTRWYDHYAKADTNLETPGSHPERIYGGLTYRLANEQGKLNDYGRMLAACSRPFLAYIGGDGLFTSKDHSYYSGETIVKRAVVLNDYFRELPVDVTWELVDKSGQTVLKREQQGILQPGERCIDRFQIMIRAPETSVKKYYTLNLQVKSADQVREDSFDLQVYPPLKPAKAKSKLFIYDPVCETSGMLQSAGYDLVPVADALPDKGLLVIGRHVLEKEKNVAGLAKLGFDDKVNNGLKVLVFEQACENVFGLRLHEDSPRRVFNAAQGHPALEGVTDEALWYWRGDSDLIAPYPQGPGDPETMPRVGWFPARFWKWGNDNSVATYVIQKPMQGAFRAVLNSGFSLMDSPLLESCKGRGRLMFCQLDVNNRYGKEPVVAMLVANLIAYMLAAPEPDPARSEVDYVAGKDRFNGVRFVKPRGLLGWGMNNGDFYFRREVDIPVYGQESDLATVKWIGRESGPIAVSVKADDFQTPWQKYKLMQVLAACRMNQGGSSDKGLSTKLHGDKDALYPINWHEGWVHPYTGYHW